MTAIFSVTPRDEPQRIGATIDGRYRVTALLGTGGMGAVFRADDLAEGHPVALKILRPHLSANPEATARFRREASVGGKIIHPNCVGISAVGTCDDGAIYLAMELLDGRSLGELLERDGPLPWQRALHIARHVLRGLHHAHEQGIVHRDIKPDNIYLCRGDGDPDVARVLDFGIAKLVGESGAPAITQTGLTIGTPEYLSPEQAAAGTLDGRSDLYSLSAVLFEMLTGRTPFYDRDLMKILIAHTNKPVPAIAEVAPGVVVPPEVEQLVRDGLAKLPDQRIPSAAAYVARIDALLAPAPATALDTVPDAGIGLVLDGRYRLETLLGRGGMGRVYRATHLGLGRAVAVKLLDAPLIDGADAHRRFEREAQAAGRLRHRNCVGVTDFGAAAGGNRYLVMELAEGTHLADLLAERTRLPVPRAVDIARHLLRGLSHAHAQGLVHRDLKPANVMLVRDGDDADVARILDFGLARMVSGDDRITRTGIACGTPRYMAPEQALDRGVDARADLYALSVILFEMLAGVTPFDHDDPTSLLRQHMTAEVPAIAAAAPGVVVPAALEQLLRRGLAKRADDRPPTAEQYLAELDRALPSADPTIELTALDLEAHSVAIPLATPPAMPRTPRPPRRPWSRRQLAIAGTCGGVLLIGIIAAIAGGTSGRGAPAAAPTAAAMPTGEDEIEIEPESKPSVGADVAKALQLANAGRPEDAVARLRELRERQPDDPQIPYALGRVYKRLNWPKQTIEAYRDAIRLDPALREDPALIGDLIGLLGSRSTWQLASRVLEQEIGAAALPALTETAANHRDATVRGRAAKLRDRL
jgi:serine/threonine protein kinase